MTASDSERARIRCVRWVRIPLGRLAAAARFPGASNFVGVEVITGEVKHYAWGDPEFIPSLLGV